MFANFMYSDNGYTHHYPIYGGSSHYEGTSSSANRRSSVLYEVNRNALVYSALQILADKGLISGKRIEKSEFAAPSDPGPEKTFTYQVYPEDIGFRFQKRMMFADAADVSKLVSFLEKKVSEEFGEDRMYMIKKSISRNEPDDVERTAQKWLKKWREGEALPL